MLSSSWNHCSLLVHEQCQIIRRKIQVIAKKAGDLLYLTCIFKDFELHWLFVASIIMKVNNAVWKYFIYFFNLITYCIESTFSKAYSAQWLVCWSQNKGLAQMFACSKLVQCGQSDCVRFSGFSSHEKNNSGQFGFTSSPGRHPSYMAKSGWCLTKSLPFFPILLIIYGLGMNLHIMKAARRNPLQCIQFIVLFLFVWQLSCLLSEISFLYEYLIHMVNYSSILY